MITHPIDTEALAKRAGHILFTDGPEQPAATAREVCVLLDLLAAAEHRATRAEAQAEARIEAVREAAQMVRDACDRWEVDGDDERLVNEVLDPWTTHTLAPEEAAE